LGRVVFFLSNNGSQELGLKTPKTIGVGANKIMKQSRSVLTC
jgi:hypothetical protein